MSDWLIDWFDLLQTAHDKGEVQEALNQLMALPGMMGYVVINFDGT